MGPSGETSGTECSVVEPASELQQNNSDWIGVAESVERRKTQNRLHQRAWRQRRAAAQPATSNFVKPKDTRRWRIDLGNQRSSSSDQSRNKNHPRSQYTTFRLDLGNHAPKATPESRRKAQQNTFRALTAQAQSQHTTPKSSDKPRFGPVMPGAPLTSDDLMAAIFPLSPDHRLLVLIQYNVLRAIMTNVAILGVFHILSDDCEGPPPDLTIGLPADTIPDQLRPTDLQLSTPHESWIDIFPSGIVRDNLILHQDKVDQEEFCDDLVGGLYEGVDDCEKRGMMVWGDPWLIESWEFSDGFARKWGFLLEGGDDLIQSTSRWRESRGEDGFV